MGKIHISVRKDGKGAHQDLEIEELLELFREQIKHGDVNLEVDQCFVKALKQRGLTMMEFAVMVTT